MTNSKFIIDLAVCTGCHACRIACKDRADNPDGIDWLTVTEKETGIFPDVKLQCGISHCWHCEKPACVDVCPASAIERDEQGLIQISREECIGCGACVKACPHAAITMHPDKTAVKCDGCSDEVANGKAPTCIRACPIRALRFADENTIPETRELDPEFISQGTKPQVVYLIRKTKES